MNQLSGFRFFRKGDAAFESFSSISGVDTTVEHGRINPADIQRREDADSNLSSESTWSYPAEILASDSYADSKVFLLQSKTAEDCQNSEMTDDTTSDVFGQPLSHDANMGIVFEDESCAPVIDFPNARDQNRVGPWLSTFEGANDFHDANDDLPHQHTNSYLRSKGEESSTPDALARLADRWKVIFPEDTRVVPYSNFDECNIEDGSVGTLGTNNEPPKFLKKPRHESCDPDQPTNPIHADGRALELRDVLSERHLNWSSDRFENEFFRDEVDYSSTKHPRRRRRTDLLVVVALTVLFLAIALAIVGSVSIKNGNRGSAAAGLSSNGLNNLETPTIAPLKAGFTSKPSSNLKQSSSPRFTVSPTITFPSPKITDAPTSKPRTPSRTPAREPTIATVETKTNLPSRTVPLSPVVGPSPLSSTSPTRLDLKVPSAAPIDTHTFAPTSLPVENPSQNLGPNPKNGTLCKDNLGCSYLGLPGHCCPTTAGVFLSCCSRGLPEISNDTIGQVASTERNFSSVVDFSLCKENFVCKSLGLVGHCCPTSDSVFLDCCHG